MKRLALVILFAGVLLACSKKSTPATSNAATFASELQTQVNDQLRISNDIDAAFNDVDSALVGDTTLCGATITVDSVDSPRLTTITYSGNTCNGLFNRTGSIRIYSDPGSSWNTAADSLTVDLTTLAVTRISDGKVMIYTGGFIYRNISGGALPGPNTGAGPVVHTITGSGVSITYDDSLHTSWRFTRQRSYTYNSGLVIATTGTDSAGGVANVADWGANRYGNSVFSAFTSPWVISQGCGWQLTGGQATMTNPIGVTILTLGLDSTGKAAGCPVTGKHYYYQMAWTGDGENPYNAIVGY